MIISHKHKFIFLKTTKTAGTSVEIGLSKFCGPDDLLTSFREVDEEIRRSLGYRVAQNHYAPLSDYTLIDWAKLALRRYKKRRFTSHVQAKFVKSFLTDYVWNNYYKFCIERNPFDRCVSYYYWKYPEHDRPEFSEYVNCDSGFLKKTGYYLYTINDRIEVDKICKYESLADDLEEVRKIIGLTEPIEIPRAKSSFRTKKRPYSEIIDQCSKEKIESLFREEMELFGYGW